MVEECKADGAGQHCDDLSRLSADRDGVRASWYVHLYLEPVYWEYEYPVAMVEGLSTFDYSSIRNTIFERKIFTDLSL